MVPFSFHISIRGLWKFSLLCNHVHSLVLKNFVGLNFHFMGRTLFQLEIHVLHDDGEWTEFLEPLPADTSRKILK